MSKEYFDKDGYVDYVNAYDTDCFARDLAMDLSYGLYKYSPKMVAQRLEDISAAELELFRRRVEYHAPDFLAESRYSVSGQVGLDVIRQGLDRVLKEVQAVPDGEAKRHFPLPVMEDRGRYFRYDPNPGETGAVILKCERSTRLAMWDEKVLFGKIDEIPQKEALRELFKEVCFEYGELDVDSGRYTMPVDSVQSLPEGMIVALETRGRGRKAVGDVDCVFILSDPEGNRVEKPVSSIDEKDAPVYLDFLSYENEEQHMVHDADYVAHVQKAMQLEDYITSYFTLSSVEPVLVGRDFVYNYKVDDKLSISQVDDYYRGGTLVKVTVPGPDGKPLTASPFGLDDSVLDDSIDRIGKALDCLLETLPPEARRYCESTLQSTPDDGSVGIYGTINLHLLPEHIKDGASLFQVSKVHPAGTLPGFDQTMVSGNYVADSGGRTRGYDLVPLTAFTDKSLGVLNEHVAIALKRDRVASMANDMRDSFKHGTKLSSIKF